MNNENLLKIKFDRNSAIPIYLQLATEIKALIMSGEISSETPLPDERTWSKALGLNRLSFRKALKKLEHAGLILRNRGTGTFVRELLMEKDIGKFNINNKKTVLVLMPFNIEHSFQGALRSVLVEKLHLAGFETICYNFINENDMKKFLNKINPLLTGIIFHQWGMQKKVENFAWLTKYDVPIVACIDNEEQIDYNCIEFDYEDCLYKATEFFILKELRDIIFISENVPLSLKSVKGYQNAMKSAGLNPVVLGRYSSPPFNPNSRCDVNAIIQGYYEAFKYFSLFSDKFSGAIITETPQLAIGVIKALKKMNYSIPENVEILTIGDDAYLDAYYGQGENPFSTIDISYDLVGQKSMELLTKQINSCSVEIEKIKLSCYLNIIERKTTHKKRSS